MVRTKKIKRDDLLEGAYHLVVDEGLGQFRARKIARAINCSTQPIYREFSNMDEFKEATCAYILNRVQTFFANRPQLTEGQLQEGLLAFAEAEPQAFQRFFLMDATCQNLIKEFIQSRYSANNENDLSFDDQWYMLLGKGALVSHGQPIS